jgi:phosphoribosyl 1,2-cyclic phosphodiesterase
LNFLSFCHKISHNLFDWSKKGTRFEWSKYRTFFDWMVLQKVDHVSRVIVMGSGCSTGIPQVSCLVKNEKCRENKEALCLVCQDSMKVDSKNRRFNTSLLLQHVVDDHVSNLLIDCGKFYYQAAMKLFPKFGISHINSVLLTHDHVDACGGLDDLRDFTDDNKIHIYSRESDFETLKRLYSYLVDRSNTSGSGYVTDLQFHPFKNDAENLEIDGIKIEVLPVEHGPTYISNGYRFGNIAYISDCSFIPDSTRKSLLNLDVLFMDFLALEPRFHKEGMKKSHLYLEESIDEVRKIKPKKAYFIGMCHQVNHDEVNGLLATLLDKEGLDIELAYDGLTFSIDL